MVCEVFFWLWLKAFLFFTMARNFRQGWQLCTRHVEMIFWWNVFFSEQIVTFRSVFGPRVKRLWTFGESVSPVSWKLHFTCPEELVERNVTIGKENSDFLYFEYEFFFPFLAYLFIGFVELCSSCLHQHLKKNLRSLIWENFVDVGENYWPGLTNLHSACPRNHFELTFLKSFKVALVFANRSGKFEAF